MTTFNCKTGLMTGTVLTLVISGLLHAQQPANLDPVLRELGIMRNIFAGAMEQTRNNKFFGNGPAPEALYLAGQGMVFSFNLPAGDGVNGFMYCDENCIGDSSDIDLDIDLVGPNLNPASPAPPAGTGSPDSSVAQEQLRAINETLRKKTDELRELRREMRTLGRQLGNNPDDQNLAARIDTVERSADELEDEVNQQNQTYQQMNADIQKQRIAAVNARREQQVEQVLGVVCDYGSTLRALPANENISLIFRNFTSNTHQVYVLSHNAVSDCTSAESLKQSAISYQL